MAFSICEHDSIGLTPICPCPLLATIFRFLRRARFNEDAALSLLATTLKWRLRTDLDMLSLSSLHPLYVSPPQHRPPLFWMGSKFVDVYGRPCGVISLQSLERTEERTLDECKEYIVACMEIARRRISQLRGRHSNRRGPRDNDTKADDPSALTDELQGPLQMVVAFDLKSSSMSNLEMELLPFLLDLLKNHFPGMVSAVYVLHYGWVHAGMWGLAKRILPAQALAKIFFPNEKEFCGEHFIRDNVPSPFGGEWKVTLNQGSNDCLTKLGRPDARAVGRRGGSEPSSPYESPQLGRKSGLSRSGSFESMADAYFSANVTPRGVSRSMTPRHSQPATPRGDATPHNDPNMLGLQMTANAARKLRNLQMTRGISPVRTRLRSEGQGKSPSFVPSTSAGSAGDGTAQASNCSFVTHGGIEGSHSKTLRDFHLDDALNSANTLPSDSYSDGGEGDADNASDTESAKSGKAGEVSTSAAGNTGRWSSRPTQLGFLRRWTTGVREKASSSAASEPLSDAQLQQVNAYSRDMATRASESVQMASQERDGEGDAELLGSPQLQVQDISSDPPIAESNIGSHASQALLDEDSSEEEGGSRSNGRPSVSLRRARKYERIPGAVSPYNASNPFWGYPAYIVPSNAPSSTNLYGLTQDLRTRGSIHRPPSGSAEEQVWRQDRQWQQTPQVRPKGGSYRVDGSAGKHRQMTVKRRWRDLFRTLSYLFVLRILALHRQLRWKAGRLLSATTKPVSRSLSWLIAIATLRSASRTRAEGAHDVDGSFDEDEADRQWREANERHRRLRAAYLMGKQGGSRGLQRASGVSRSVRAQSASSVTVALVVFVIAWRLASRRGNPLAGKVRGAVA